MDIMNSLRWDGVLFSSLCHLFFHVFILTYEIAVCFDDKLFLGCFYRVDLLHGLLVDSYTSKWDVYCWYFSGWADSIKKIDQVSERIHGRHANRCFTVDLKHEYFHSQ